MAESAPAQANGAENSLNIDIKGAKINLGDLLPKDATEIQKKELQAKIDKIKSSSSSADQTKVLGEITNLMFDVALANDAKVDDNEAAEIKKNYDIAKAALKIETTDKKDGLNASISVNPALKDNLMNSIISRIKGNEFKDVVANLKGKDVFEFDKNVGAGDQFSIDIKDGWIVDTKIIPDGVMTLLMGEFKGDKTVKTKDSEGKEVKSNTKEYDEYLASCVEKGETFVKELNAKVNETKQTVIVDAVQGSKVEKNETLKESEMTKIFKEGNITKDQLLKFQDILDNEQNPVSAERKEYLRILKSEVTKALPVILKEFTITSAKDIQLLKNNGYDVKGFDELLKKDEKFKIKLEGKKVIPLSWYEGYFTSADKADLERKDGKPVTKINNEGIKETTVPKEMTDDQIKLVGLMGSSEEVEVLANKNLANKKAEEERLAKAEEERLAKAEQERLAQIGAANRKPESAASETLKLGENVKGANEYSVNFMKNPDNKKLIDIAYSNLSKSDDNTNKETAKLLKIAVEEPTKGNIINLQKNLNAEYEGIAIIKDGRFGINTLTASQVADPKNEVAFAVNEKRSKKSSRTSVA